jgi:hypothetical protein
MGKYTYNAVAMSRATVPTSIRLPIPLNARLRRRAKSEGVSLQTLVVTLLEHACKLKLPQSSPSAKTDK